MLDFVVHTLHKQVTIPLRTATQSLVAKVARSTAKFAADLVGVSHPLEPTYQANLQWGLRVHLDCLSLATHL